MPPIRRKVYLINRKFQLRFSFYVCSWLIALSLGYPLILSSVFDGITQYLAMDPTGPALATIEKTRQDVLWLMILMQTVLVLLTFFISIFMSHKIAGPLYKLRKFFIEARDGQLDQRLSFRKRDYFQELVPAYNDMMEAIRKRMQTKNDGILAAMAQLEKMIPRTNIDVRSELEAALKALKNAQKS